MIDYYFWRKKKPADIRWPTFVVTPLLDLLDVECFLWPSYFFPCAPLPPPLTSLVSIPLPASSGTQKAADWPTSWLWNPNHFSSLQSGGAPWSRGIGPLIRALIMVSKKQPSCWGSLLPQTHPCASHWMSRNPLQLNAVVIIQLWAEAFWELRSDASPLEKNSFWRLQRNHSDWDYRSQVLFFRSFQWLLSIWLCKCTLLTSGCCFIPSWYCGISIMLYVRRGWILCTACNQWLCFLPSTRCTPILFKNICAFLSPL